MRAHADFEEIAAFLYTAHSRGGPVERVMVAATHRLRVFEIQDLSPDEVAEVRKLLWTKQLVRRSIMLVVPEIAAPLCTWPEGCRRLELAKIAWLGRKRWRDSPRRRITFCRATHRAAKVWGGIGGPLSQPLQLQHDLALSRVYFAARAHDQTAVATWISEDLYRDLSGPGPGEKVPDALILDEHGRPERAIELAGLYSRRRIEAFVRDCVDKELPFEIW